MKKPNLNNHGMNIIYRKPTVYHRVLKWQNHLFNVTLWLSSIRLIQFLFHCLYLLWPVCEERFLCYDMVLQIWVWQSRLAKFGKICWVYWTNRYVFCFKHRSFNKNICTYLKFKNKEHFTDTCIAFISVAIFPRSLPWKMLIPGWWMVPKAFVD